MQKVKFQSVSNIFKGYTSFIVIFLLICVFFLSCTIDKKKDYRNFELWDEWFLYNKDGSELFVREFGDGDTVIILHGGWGAEHSYLITPFLELADKYHFVFYDQRGSLRSPCPDSLISVENHIEDIEQLRKELNLEKLLIIGHSMGTFLGMSYAEKYPDNVKGLVLIASVPAKGSAEAVMESEKDVLKRWERQEVLDTLKVYGLKVEDWSTYNSKRSSTLHRITFAAINLHHVKNWRKEQSAFYYRQNAGMMAAMTHPENWDFTKILEKLQIPITVIQGDDDYISIKMNEEWVQEASNAELKVIKNAGHNCWIDNPEQFHTFISEALKKYNNKVTN
jgi:proline-specific peptidase